MAVEVSTSYQSPLVLLETDYNIWNLFLAIPMYAHMIQLRCLSAKLTFFFKPCGSVGGAQFCVDAAQGYVSSRKQVRLFWIKIPTKFLIWCLLEAICLECIESLNFSFNVAVESWYCFEYLIIRNCTWSESSCLLDVCFFSSISFFFHVVWVNIRFH